MEPVIYPAADAGKTKGGKGLVMVHKKSAAFGAALLPFMCAISGVRLFYPFHFQ